MVRAALTTALEVAGFAAVSAGCWLIFVPLGVIVAGLALVLIGWRLA